MPESHPYSHQLRSLVKVNVGYTHLVKGFGPFRDVVVAECTVYLYAGLTDGRGLRREDRPFLIDETTARACGSRFGRC